MSLRLSPLVGFPYFLRVLLGRPMLHLVHWGQFPQLLEIVQLQQLFGSNPFLRVGDQHPHQGCHKVVCEEREPAVGHLCADVDRWELVRVASQLVHEAHILEASQSVFVHKLDDGTTAYETGDGLESVSLALEREGFAVSEEGEHNDGETPNIGRGCYVSRPEEQLGRIKTGGALAEIGVVPWEVKAGEIPIN